MPNVQRGAVVHSIQRLFDQGTVVALDERQLPDRFVSRGDVRRKTTLRELANW
jgi:hypothetical protein